MKNRKKEKTSPDTKLIIENIKHILGVINTNPQEVNKINKKVTTIRKDAKKYINI